MTRTNGTGTALPAPRCPRCQGLMHDNRADKSSPKAPDFRCRNANCVDDEGRRTAAWERGLIRAAGNGKPAPRQPDPAPAPLPPAAAFRALATLHRACLTHVLKHYAPKLETLGGDTAGAVSALCAQLFIAANERGITVPAQRER